jgi:SPP1 family predicted phage head-tail adaptor
MAIAAGRLNRRVAIQEVSRVGDGGGGWTETWATVATVWARVAPASGSEEYRAQQTQSATIYEVEIRHRTDVTPQMRIVYAGKELYVIQPPYSPNEARETLVLVCEHRNV